MNSRLRETLIRIASALVALPVYFLAIITDVMYSLPILLISILITLICLYEFYLIAEHAGTKPFKAVGMAAAVLLNVLMYLYSYGKILGVSSFRGTSFHYIIFIITIFVAIICILHLFKRPIQGGIFAISATILGLVLIVIPFAHIILMKSLRDGVFYIMLLNITVILNDVAAYFGGVLLGKHKINFPVSPNKSWEGYCFALFFCVLSTVLFSQFCLIFYSRNLFSLQEAVIAGILISLSAAIGDLVESAVKRDSGIKDSGSIVPGHGGMWDVFDAMIFTMPLFYYYIVFFKDVH